MSLQCFWTLNMIGPLLSMQGQKALGFQQKCLDLSSEDERRSYSFVVGSDGYIYEGRGWTSVGAHTKGRNSVGYGVAFIGNYAAHLPSKYDMELLRHHLVKCGVSRGYLQKNFTILGHRQVVATTTCPGDSLYSEITTWEHYKDTDPLK